MHSGLQFGLVAAGGALGAMARHATQILFSLSGRPVFPWGTLVVNVGGSFLGGALLVLLLQGHAGQGGWRMFAMVGFLGAYTTFSTFAVDTLLLAEQGQWRLALVNAVLNLALALAACVLGAFAARVFSA